MGLGAEQILRARREGAIVIEPFDEGQLGPNSYNIRLGKKLWVPSPNAVRRVDGELVRVKDPKMPGSGYGIDIPEEGWVLMPGQLVLGHSMEMVGSTRRYIPIYEGRSSFARLGQGSHVTAGFGDVGFARQWTLELFVVGDPIVLYPGTQVGQVYWLDTGDDEARGYEVTGNYRNQEGPQPSMWWRHQDRKGGKE